MTIRWALLQVRRHRLLAASAVVLGTLTVLASFGLMSTSGYMISRAALRPPILDLMVVIVAVRFFGIARAGVRYAERMTSHDLTFRLLLHLRCWLYERLEPIIPRHRVYHHSGDLLARLVSDIENLQSLYLRVASPVLVAVMVTVATAGLLWWLEPAAAVATTIGILLCGVALPVVVLGLARKTAAGQIKLRAALQRHLVDTVAGMEDTLGLGTNRRRQDEHDQLTNALARLERRHARIGAIHQITGTLVTWGTVVVVLFVTIPRIQTGELSGLLLAAAAFGVIASFEAVQLLPSAYQYLEQAGEACRRISEIAGEPSLILVPRHPLPVPEKPSFSFRNVGFTFPGSLRPAVCDLSFDLPFRSKIAVLGPSGAGKSTIVQMLCRFFDPQDGRVLLDGRDLSEYSLTALRARLGVVLQHPHIFNTTIRENLLLAKPEATESELFDVLEKVNLASFIKTLPKGLDTIPGSEGLSLSGGQRQRLALAQTLLKNAPVLVLDEATANLDLETEREILDRVFELTKDRTLVVITHRPENLTGLDAIVRLRDGQLAEVAGS